jgi:hypothetical protein
MAHNPDQRTGMGGLDLRWTRIGPANTCHFRHWVVVHATFVVIPASAPGSIAGKGKWPPRQMDPGAEAGMTMGLVTAVEAPT